MLGPSASVAKCAKRLKTILDSVEINDMQILEKPSKDLQQKILKETGVKVIY